MKIVRSKLTFHGYALDRPRRLHCPNSATCLNPTDGLSSHMPTVLDVGGFHVRVLLPPREHGPPHVHVYKAGGLVVIDLPDIDQPLSVRRVSAMRDADVVKAFRLVEAHVDFLLSQWRRYHE
jgi:hypothetical protein